MRDRRRERQRKRERQREERDSSERKTVREVLVVWRNCTLRHTVSLSVKEVVVGDTPNHAFNWWGVEVGWWHRVGRVTWANLSDPDPFWWVWSGGLVTHSIRGVVRPEINISYPDLFWRICELSLMFSFLFLRGTAFRQCSVARPDPLGYD